VSDTKESTPKEVAQVQNDPAAVLTTVENFILSSFEVLAGNECNYTYDANVITDADALSSAFIDLHKANSILERLALMAYNFSSQLSALNGSTETMFNLYYLQDYCLKFPREKGVPVDAHLTLAGKAFEQQYGYTAAQVKTLATQMLSLNRAIDSRKQHLNRTNMDLRSILKCLELEHKANGVLPPMPKDDQVTGVYEPVEQMHMPRVRLPMPTTSDMTRTNVFPTPVMAPPPLPAGFGS
jgi:hypothetical protein